MSHVALYRKYRSQNFDELVGQEHVIRTLKNAIDLGKISQTYLFTGPRGTGKTSTARLLAKALNCTGGPSSKIPDDCPICEDITRGNCMDVIEIDAASESGVDDVRDHIVLASEYKPTYCRYKIFIIDEVHDLSSKAFDALLKTIEEPPDHIIFILATTEFHKVPATIKSRCQKFEFHRGSLHDLISRLTFVAEQEQVEVDSAALAAIARMADGGFRDALTLFEQAMITSDGRVTLDHVYDQLGLIADETADGLILSLVEGEIIKILTQVEAVYRTGRDPSAIVESLLYRLSDLTRSVFDLKDAPETDSTLAAASSSVAQRLGAEKILTLRSFLAETHKALRDVSLPRIWLEAEFVRIAQRLNAPIEKDRTVLGDKVTGSVVRETRASVSASATPKPSRSHSETHNSLPANPEPEVSAKSESSETASERRIENKPAQVRRIESSHPMAEKWDAIVEKLSEKSPTAKMRLLNSKLVDANDKRVKIEYARIVDAEWVSENKKLQPALIAEWKASTGHDVYFEHVGPGDSSGKAIPAPVIEKASVESPLTGEALASEVIKTFDVQQDN